MNTSTADDAPGSETKALPASENSGDPVFSEAALWLDSLLTGGAKTGVPATWFRKIFTVPAALRSASLQVTALGLYECELNGAVVGDSVLAPGWTDYTKRLYVQRYTVTDQLVAGENVIGLVLGDGWYAGHIAENDRQFYGPRPRFRLELTLETAAGKTVRVASDASWRAAVGPLLANDLIMGEDYDARLAWPGWSQAGFDDADWQSAPTTAIPPIALAFSPAPPVRRQEVFAPVEPDALQPRKRSRRQVCLLDFGQNLSGRLRLTVQGQRGACLTIRHGEMLDDRGALYTGNLRKARATDHYTLRGGEPETWEPRFTFHGFRYAEITWDARFPVMLQKVTAIALYSDMALTGHFECSEPLVNQLAHNIHWGLRGNFLDIPTDCPQRDERLGWTGDVRVFIHTATLHREVRGFFHKWLQDLRDAQRANGAMPSIAPDSASFSDREDGGPAWSDVVYIAPWVLYEQYGDREILAAQFDCMRRHFDYLTTHRVKDHIREHPDLGDWHGFGDWLAPDGSGRLTGATPQDLIGTAYYAEAARILAATAAILDESAVAAEFQARRQQIVRAFQQRFVTPAGLLAAGTQTAYALALHFNLIPSDNRPAAGAELARLVRANGDRMTTGFVGTACILHALEATGHLDVAYALLEQTKCPSWLFPVRHGATTMWERWDAWTPEQGFHPAGMNSFNHYAHGAVGEWLFATVAGMVPAAPGYARILFKPRPGGHLTAAAASLKTPYGEVAIAWQRDASRLLLRLTVPPGTEAELSLPPGWTAPDTVLVAGTQEVVAEPLGDQLL